MEDLDVLVAEQQLGEAAELLRAKDMELARASPRGELGAAVGACTVKTLHWRSLSDSRRLSWALQRWARVSACVIPLLQDGD